MTGPSTRVASGSLRIGLLVVGHVAEPSQYLAGDYPELFTTVLDSEPDISPFELVRYDLDRDRFPDSIDECDGWLLSPSRCSVYDAHPWIASAEDLVRELIHRERRYVGVCFGHQLAAQALGVLVQRAADGWQVGVHDYDVVAPQAWMAPPTNPVALIASHEDQVTAVPDGTELLFRTPGCPVAGLMIGERAWTIQPHPEFGAELADHLLAQRVQLIGADRVATARATLGRPLDRATVGRWIARFFTTS